MNFRKNKTQNVLDPECTQTRAHTHTHTHTHAQNTQHSGRSPLTVYSCDTCTQRSEDFLEMFLSPLFSTGVCACGLCEHAECRKPLRRHATDFDRSFLQGPHPLPSSPARLHTGCVARGIPGNPGGRCVTKVTKVTQRPLSCKRRDA